MNQEMKTDLRPDVTAWAESRFGIVEELAPSSGQRFVFRAEDRVIKIFPPLDDAEIVRCRREVDFLTQGLVQGLPKALTQLESGQISDNTYYWYEETWIDAPSLTDFLAVNGPDPTSATQVLTEGASILAGLHANSVVHRDISPNNILVGEDRIYAVDLGLAKYLDLEPLTQSSDRLKMTVLFASPEQLSGGHSHLSPATDIYSLGLVVIHAATGGHSFLAPGENLSPNDYLARMAHRDLQVATDQLPPRVLEMIEPLAPFRPTAQAIIGGD